MVTSGGDFCRGIRPPAVWTSQTCHLFAFILSNDGTICIGRLTRGDIRRTRNVNDGALGSWACVHVSSLHQ